MANEYIYIQTGIALTAAGGGVPSIVITHNFGTASFCAFDFATADPVVVPRVRFHTKTNTQVTIENDSASPWTGGVVLRRAHSLWSPGGIVSGVGTLNPAQIPRYECLFTNVTVPAGAPGQLDLYHNLGTPLTPFAPPNNILAIGGTVSAVAAPTATRVWDTAGLVFDNSVTLNNSDGVNDWTGDVWVIACPVGDTENHPVRGTKFWNAANPPTPFDVRRYMYTAFGLTVFAGTLNRDLVHNLGNSAGWQEYCLFGYTADPNTTIGPWVANLDQGAAGTTTRLAVTAAGGHLANGKVVIGRHHSIER